MSFFGALFHRSKNESVALIDISASSVLGAYAHFAEGELPLVVYTRRLPIEVQTGEAREAAMLRALDVLGASLASEGAPALERATGRSTINSVLLSLDTPWQETQVQVEQVVADADFVFTKRLVAEQVQKASPPAPGKAYVDASVIGTVINGYDMHEPYGKRVHRASIVVLTSEVAEATSNALRAAAQRLFHTKRISLISDSSVRYQAMRIAFPHERDALILDATGAQATILLMRRGMLVAIAESAEGTSEAGATAELEHGFGEITKRYPLPRTIFLLVRDADVASLAKRLESVKFGSLWLSDKPPTIIPVLASRVASFVRQTTTVAPDLPLLLMALYYEHLDKKV